MAGLADTKVSQSLNDVRIGLAGLGFFFYLLTTVFGFVAVFLTAGTGVASL